MVLFRMTLYWAFRRIESHTKGYHKKGVFGPSQIIKSFTIIVSKKIIEKRDVRSNLDPTDIDYWRSEPLDVHPKLSYWLCRQSVRPFKGLF